MTIGAVTSDTENTAISNAPAVHQPADDSSAGFSEALKASDALSGGRADLDIIFEAAGRRYCISPKLLKAVAKAESDFRPDATSRVGAMGIMQLMPGTAKYLGVTDPYDPEQNIMGGAKYLREMLDKYNGDLKLALAAYNAGPGTISRNGGEPLQSQLQGYIPKILRYYNGGDITAGTVSYNSFGVSGSSGEANGSPDYTAALKEMLFMKIIEMQMQSTDDDDKKKVF